MAVKTKKETSEEVKAAPVYLVTTDIGFGGSKTRSNTGYRGVMPSTVEIGDPKQSKMFKHTEVEEDKLIVTTADGTYHVGEQAMKVNKLLVSSRTIIRDRANDPKFRTLFQTNVAMGLPHESGEYNVFITTGLPNTDFNKRIKDNLAEFIKQGFEITIHLGFGKSITKKINVIGFEIFRQPEGTVTRTQFRFLEDGLVQSDLWRSNTGVIDIGHLTTDFGLFADGVFLDIEGTYDSTIATSEMYKRLKVKMSNFFDEEFSIEYDPSDEELDQAVREKSIHYNGTDHNMTALVDEAAAEIAAKIATAVLNAWGQHASRVQIILLTGGGAYIFAEHLKKEFADRKVQGFVTVDDAQMANVNGFYMLGALSFLETDDDGNVVNFKEVYEQYIKPVLESEAA